MHPNLKGSDAGGRLPDGTWVKLDFHRDTVLEDIKATGGQMIPAALLAPVMPKAVMEGAQYPHDGWFSKVEFGDTKIELEGTTAAHQTFKAEYAPSGKLLKWKHD